MPTQAQSPGRARPLRSSGRGVAAECQSSIIASEAQSSSTSFADTGTVESPREQRECQELGGVTCGASSSEEDAASSGSETSSRNSFSAFSSSVAPASCWPHSHELSVTYEHKLQKRALWMAAFVTDGFGRLAESQQILRWGGAHHEPHVLAPLPRGRFVVGSCSSTFCVKQVKNRRH